MNKALFALVVACFLLPATSYADAVLYISPEKGNYTVGQTFVATVSADTGGQAINAAEGDISFNADALEVESISEDGSILTSWSTTPVYSNDDGTIRFAGWAKNNFNGPDGLLITITFKALRNMVGNARLAAGAILAADGAESNIITGMHSAVFAIAPVQQPDPNAPQSGDGTDASSTDGTDASASSTAKIPAPAFDDAPDSVAVGDHIVIRGNAEPNSHVSVFIARGTETEQETDILAASDGSFTYVSPDTVSAGAYHVRATAKTDDGRESVPSDGVDITVAPQGAAASALFGASLLFETLPFFALLVLGGLGAAYLYHRHQLVRMRYAQSDEFFAGE